MNKGHSHICLPELDLILFNVLYLNGLNAVTLRKLPVAPGLLILFAGYIVKPVVKKPVACNCILLKQVMKITLNIIVRSREVAVEKNLDRQRIGQC